MPDVLIDGNFTGAEPIGAARWDWPFRVNGDYETALFDQDYWQLKSSFVPQKWIVPFTVSNFFLVKETAPIPVTAEVVRFTRTWSRIPATQNIYSSLSLNKPRFTTNYNEGYYVDSTDATATATIWKQIVTASSVARYPSGGTFTVTYKTSTTAALAYNASNGTIAAAINALADLVTDSSTVTIANTMSSDGIITITLATGAADIGADTSINISSITPACYQNNVTQTSSELSVKIQRNSLTYTKTAHGLSNGQAIRTAPSESSVDTATTVTSIVDPDNFTIANPFTGANYALATRTYYRIVLRTYTPGVGRVRSKVVSTFYLPGITSGITTAADITAPASLLGEAAFLSAVLANPTGYVNYDTESLSQWIESSIWQLTCVQINMADL